MPISHSTSAPLFAVLGATGRQGGSVVRAIQDSSTEFRVRAITRDATKPAAKALGSLGCSVETIHDFGTVKGARKAFEGADVVFAITMTDTRQKEYERGTAQMDAAKAERIKIVVWSGQLNFEKLSNGKLKSDMMDVKQDVAEYARSLNAFELIDVQPGAFSYNFVNGTDVPRKGPSGQFLLGLPYDASTLIPIVDVADYGHYVLGAIDRGMEEVHAAPEYLTPGQIADLFTKVTGKKVTYVRMPDEVLHAVLSQRCVRHMADALMEMFRAIDQFGYFAGRDLAPSNKILSRPARTFEEILRINKEAVDKLLA